MSLRIYSIIFVILWASAFVSAKYGMSGAGPFSFLSTRFAIVMVIFGLAALVFRQKWPSRGELTPTIIGGVLMHGVYLGSVFYAISIGTPAGIASLIVSIQPIITALLAMAFLGDTVRRVQWVGMALGLIGVVLVVLPRLSAGLSNVGLDGAVPKIGLITCIIGVCAMAVGTLIQKRYLSNINLISGNALQAMAAAAFYGLLLITIEDYHLVWTTEVTLSMIWIVAAVSLGAITILMFLIRSGQLAATSSLFFMVPPVVAVMGYFAFDEMLGVVAIIGFMLASLGVWLVNKPQKS